MNAKWLMALGIVAGAAVSFGLLYMALAPVEDAAPSREKPAHAARPSEPARPLNVAEVPPRVETSNDVADVAAPSPERRPVYAIGQLAATDFPASGDGWVDALPERYRNLARGIVEASDNDDLDALRRLQADAQSCRSVEVRQRMVDALSCFGADAIGDLTPFLQDRDKEVARSAFSAWDSAVGLMDNDAKRVKLCAEAMKTLQDEESLAAVSARLKAAEDPGQSIGVIIDIIDTGNEKSVEAAKEAYEFIAGEPWTDRSTAFIKASLLSSRH